jgi:putative transposase
MPGPKPVPIDVTDAQRRALQTLVNTHDEPHILVVRAWIILLAHLGHSTRYIARYLHISEDSVGHWKQRWRDLAKTGLGETDVCAWLSDAPKSGTPPTITAEQWCQIMALACSDPKDSGRPLSHWTQRELREEILKRRLVEHLSLRHLGRFFKRSPPQAPSQSLLADPAGQSGAGSHHSGGV